VTRASADSHPTVGGTLTAVSVASLAIAALVVAAGAMDAALAQSGPFGVPRAPAPPPPPDGIIGWLLVKQAEFYRGLSGALRAAKADGSAVLGLFGLAFAYGVFHAAGPGHGKAVISSYILANDETWRRGIVLSFASALLQALVAIALVGIAAALLGATAKAMGDTVRVIEIVSYGLIIAIGARLLWVKGGSFVRTFAEVQRSRAPMPLGAAATHVHDHHPHEHAAHHHHGSETCGACGHAHGPDPEALAGAGGWRRGLSAIVAVGLRPCSGAVLVLVFAHANGLFWAGVGATLIMGLGTAITVAAIASLAVGAKSLAARFASASPGYGTVAIRGIEVLAAALVLAFGVLLLSGYMASERLMGL
jgi:nickel/cobalt exporter